MPVYERPAAPVPPQWPAASLPDASSVPDSSQPVRGLGWEAFYADATVQELIRTALAHNRDIRVAALNIAQARAQLGLRQADQRPSVGAALSGSRMPAGDGAISSTYSAGLTLSAFELDFFDRMGSLTAQAQALVLASAYASQTVRISLMSAVAQGWLTLLADEELLRLSRQTLASRQEAFGLITLKQRHGAASELEARLAQTLLESARVALAQQTQKRATDENALALLLGQSLPDTARARLASARLEALHLTRLPAGLPSDVLTQRPDIRQTEQLLMASNANIGAARAAFYPRITLTAGAGTASSELSGLFKNGSWGWTLAPQLVLPIFDAGRNQANLDAAQTGRDLAVAQYEKSIQTAFKEVADALAGQANLDAQLQASQALLAAESERARLTRLRLDNGAASQLDWLDAQRALFSAQQAVVQTRLALLQNQITLFKSLGGGAEDPADQRTAAR